LLRRRAACSTLHLVPLRPEEHRVLQAAADAGGRYSIRGLPLREMVRAADVVLTMQTAGLVKTTIQFQDRQPYVIPIEITAEGRRVLKSDQPEKQQQ
jgi:hypothetical protein